MLVVIRALCTAIAIMLVIAPLQSATAKSIALDSPDAVLVWINGYKQKPEPKRFAEALHAMSRLGLLADQETAGVYVGFLAGIIGTNQLDAPKLIERAFPLKGDEEVTLIKAIAFSGLPEWQALLRRFEAKMPERQFLIERYMTGEEQPLSGLPVDTGRMLDTHWGYYMASGYYEPAVKIIHALRWSADKEDIDRLTVGSMAKWTLASNASRDERLLQLCKTEMEHQPEEIAGPLSEVVEAARTYELTLLRKNALAAIDELKAKGPQSSRNWAWARQAGSTLIALGCIAAGIAGQAQVGVPCVVTGALTQAAEKLWLQQ